MKIKRCVICRRRKRVRGFKLCQTHLNYYRYKYGQDLDDEEFEQLLKSYQEMEEKEWRLKIK